MSPPSLGENRLAALARHLTHGPVLSKHLHPHGGLNRRVALWLTFGFGSMWAFWLLVGWQLGWIAWQTSGWHVIIHDPYPFGFCLFLSNLIQLWALPAIMVGQNVLQAQADARAASDHAILAGLDQINQQQLEILRRLETSS